MYLQGQRSNKVMDGKRLGPDTWQIFSKLGSRSSTANKKKEGEGRREAEREGRMEGYSGLMEGAQDETLVLIYGTSM